MPELSFDIDAVVEGRARLTSAGALELHEKATIHDLGQWALAMSRRLHPEDYRTYVIDRNINYTNVCSAHCAFCAFRRDAAAPDAYTLSIEQVLDKIRELVAIGGTQTLMQGGMNPDLPMSYYEDLLRAIKAEFPHVHIHAFSPPEFVEFERLFGMDARDILRRFRAAGLDSIPGGGGEILIPRVRRRISGAKADADNWLRIMRIAHEEGMDTSATMLIGHIEFISDRIDHLNRLRDLQDYALSLSAAGSGPLAGDDVAARVRASWPGVFARSPYPGQADRPAGSYTAFIEWPFQPENTPLGRCRVWDPDRDAPFDESSDPDVQAGRVIRLAGATEYLRTLAISRLFLDNVRSVQSSWVTMGPKIGQLALLFGANDMGSVMMEEQVVSAAGTSYRLNEREICRLIRDAGWIPAQRDQFYHVLKRHDGPESPDRVPMADPPMRHVRRLDNHSVGRAPGLDSQLPILGDEKA